MKLFIRLHNTTTTIDSIRSALRNTNIEVALEDERIVLATSDLIAFQFDPNDNAQIDATWGRVRELLAIVNGAAKALRLHGIELDWTNLYRIYEIIIEDAKQATIFARRWASQDEIETFKASANNASVSGDLARHGTMKNGKPKQTMSMARSRHVIRRVLSNWLNSKIK